MEGVDESAVGIAGGGVDDHPDGLVDDEQVLVLEEDVERNVLGNLWKALLESIDEPQRSKIDPKIATPLSIMTKEGIVRYMDPELFKLTWSCRNPTLINDMDVVPCGKCLPCIHLAEIRRRIS